MVAYNIIKLETIKYSGAPRHELSWIATPDFC
jgi:hypothetical protein